MARLGGADEIVVGQFQLLGERLPVGRQFVAVGLRRFAFRQRRLLDLLAVLVEAGQEEDLLPQAAPRPRDDVGDDLLVGMAEMRLAVDVINRGGDVKPFVHCRTHSLADKRRLGNLGAQFTRQSCLLQGLVVLQCLSAVAENQPTNKNRMNIELSNFAARVREVIQGRDAAPRRPVGAARRPYQEPRI